MIAVNNNYNQDFNMYNYLDIITPKIITILSRPIKEFLTYDMLDTEKNKSNKLIALKEKQRQMKIGEIMQTCLGNYDTFIDLGVGHYSGLDIMSAERKIIIELKNRTNTDNASSRKSNLDKLALFKKNNPNYLCIYGCVNDDTEEKTMMGGIKQIVHKDGEIYQYVGDSLLTLILEDNKTIIIDYIRTIITNYYIDND
jgi:hypothetical protein